ILGILLSKDSIEDILKRRGYEYSYIENPRKSFTENALTLTGTKYTLGASVLRDAPREFDCSGLVAYSATQVGIAIPRISVDQYFFSSNLSEEDVQPGDLLFALTPGGGMHTHSKEWMPGLQIPEGVDHVAIMLSNTEVFHTSRHNPEGARKETLEDFMKIHTLRGYKRIPSMDEPRFVVTVPPERLDIRIREDLVKEIGRTYGYETLEAKKIEPLVGTVAIEKIDYYSNVIRDALTSIGFSEVMTYAFQNSGEVELQNPLASDKAFLRSSLVSGLSQSRDMNMYNLDLLGLSQIAIFEIGNVFTENCEYLSLGVTIGNPKGFKAKDGDVTMEKVTEILSSNLGIPVVFEEKDGVYTLNMTDVLSRLPSPETPLTFGEFPQTRFKRYSEYPAILRDIAVFIPEGQSEMEIIEEVKKEAGDLLVNYRLFDTFTKEFPEGKKTSYAYRLVFQSMDRTLTDAEITPMMERVTAELNGKAGFQVR
ncbi:C40 family peptidase, partial [Patescibacteria group bacterium]|nr:C40 family peptidase [Patescibacteria group bacterium]